MPKLPEEITTDILLRLPVKSLARCRCVSKSWNSLLCGSSFITAHLRRSSQPLNRRFLLKYTVHHVSKLRTFSPSLDHSLDLTSPLNRVGTTIDLSEFELIGVLNGVLCLSTSHGLKPCTTEISLWNPSINQLFTLPKSHFPVSQAIGFGHNPFSGHLNDFKVLKISEVKFKGQTWSRVEVYSLITNSWKKLEDSFPPGCSVFVDGQQVVVNQFICWCPHLGLELDSTSVKSSIQMFDTVNEEFRDMELPQSLHFYRKHITLSDDRLCVIASLRSIRLETNMFEVWVMKEFGKVQSWTKLYAFELSIRMFPLYKQLGLGNDGCVLFAHNYSVEFELKLDSHLAIFNTIKGKIDRVFKIRFDSIISSCVYPYAESLVPTLPKPMDR